MIFDILNNPEKIENDLQQILLDLHEHGPINQENLEKLALYKYFASDIFKKYESDLMYLLGLFYKTEKSDSLLSFAYSLFKDEIYKQTNNYFTPVQNSIYSEIENNINYSFSAPTSTGKSFLFRELLKKYKNDVVIVVPSRALIAEYIAVLRNTFKEDKSILILSFVENINILKTSRRIFVLTPERLPELYKNKYSFKVDLFLFDEAQIADDKIRGINFANIVKQSEKKYPDAKKVFAHPFIENPDVQLEKLNLQGSSHSFNQMTVGKIFIQEKQKGYYLFNPYDENSHLLRNQYFFDTDIIEKLLREHKTILFYVSKASIVSKRILSDFKKYITLCEEVNNPEALEIIEKIQNYIDAKDERNSFLVYMLKKGIVIHHGSIPLDIRFILEKFTNLGFSKICFSTSTLLQGVNMPFDALFIDNFRFYGNNNEKNLGLKNLIGRAGRTTNSYNNFEYGFIVVRNSKTFSERLKQKSMVESTSVIENNDPQMDDYYSETKDAVKENTIDAEYNEPETRLKRITSSEIQRIVERLISILFEKEIMREYGSFSEKERGEVRLLFRHIYEKYINRQLLTGEIDIFNTALIILLWRMQGNSFKKILNLRYALIAHGSEIRNIIKLFDNGQISREEEQRFLEGIAIEYTPIPQTLPNKSLQRKGPSSFGWATAYSFDYDSLVYDTYDYLDKVVEFSLINPFTIVFQKYFEETGNIKAERMISYLKYGSIDKTKIYLQKYGFSYDQIDLLGDSVISADENHIIFDENKIKNVRDPITMELVSRYI